MSRPTVRALAAHCSSVLAVVRGLTRVHRHAGPAAEEEP